MIELLEGDKPFSAHRDNMLAFNRFRDSLRKAVKLDSADLLATVRITGYRHDRLYRFEGKILLINRGISAGRIWIDDGEEGFSEENFVLGSPNKTYSTGRTGSELVVEIPTIEYGLRRVDLEEVPGR